MTNIYTVSGPPDQPMKPDPNTMQICNEAFTDIYMAASTPDQPQNQIQTLCAWIAYRTNSQDPFAQLAQASPAHLAQATGEPNPSSQPVLAQPAQANHPKPTHPNPSDPNPSQPYQGSHPNQSQLARISQLTQSRQTIPKQATDCGHGPNSMAQCPWVVGPGLVGPGPVGQSTGIPFTRPFRW